MRRILVSTILVSSVLWAVPAGATGGARQCDFDGDGYDDAAIGVSGEAVGTVQQAGAVNVIYGSQDKLTSIDDQLWTQNSAGLEGAAEASDQFGATIECGDFNNDGYADLVIASPSESIDTAPNAGAIHLLFGTPGGLTGEDSLLLHRNVPGVAGQAALSDRWGSSLAVGDFNGDSKDDLAVGAPLDDVAGLSAVGTVQVFYGFAGGLSTDNDEIWHRGKTGVKGKLRAGTTFGQSLATGDFNGDGKDDLAVGAAFDPVKGLDAAGSVHVLYGSSAGLTTAADDVFHRATRGIRGTLQGGDGFGFALAAGDFDNNGYDELAIGVPFDDIGSSPNVGSVHVLQGGANGLGTAGDKIWHRARPGIRGNSGAQDLFGVSLTSGQFNGDMHDDLAIGVSGDTIGVVVGTGSVHVIYGSGTGLSAADDQIWHQNTKGINGTNELNDSFGDSISSGDFDGNGESDLLIGVPLEDGQTTSDSGGVAVIYGWPARLVRIGDQRWSQDSAGILGVAEDADRMGRRVAGSGGV